MPLPVEVVKLHEVEKCFRSELLGKEIFNVIKTLSWLDFSWQFCQTGRLEVLQGKIGASQGILEGICNFYLSTMNVCSVLGVYGLRV
jgi:hypothetical protein